MLPDFSRYACQIKLPGFGELAQRMLQNAKVLVCGAGGLGCPALQYLAATGVGTIGIVDFDNISFSNLHRQIIFTPQQAGLKKTATAAAQLRAQNPDITVVEHDTRLNDENIIELVKDYDLVLDCTDNFETKYLINDACVISEIPLIYGSIYQYEGQVSFLNGVNEDGSRSANYRDFFPGANARVIPDCSEGGVFPTLAGIIGCIQANEAIKYITQTGELLIGKMLLFDAQTMLTKVISASVQVGTPIKAIEQQVSIPTITVEEFKSNEDKYFLIDVRTPEEHAEFNIGGINVPLNEIEDISTYLETDKPVLLYCSVGRRSSEAVKIINQLFVHDIYSLKNGLKDWQ